MFARPARRTRDARDTRALPLVKRTAPAHSARLPIHRSAWERLRSAMSLSEFAWAASKTATARTRRRPLATWPLTLVCPARMTPAAQGTTALPPVKRTAPADSARLPIRRSAMVRRRFAMVRAESVSPVWSTATAATRPLPRAPTMSVRRACRTRGARDTRALRPVKRTAPAHSARLPTTPSARERRRCVTRRSVFAWDARPTRTARARRRRAAIRRRTPAGPARATSAAWATRGRRRANPRATVVSAR